MKLDPDEAMDYWVCKDCDWEGEEYLLRLVISGTTRWKECPNCGSVNLIVEDENDQE